MVGDMRVRGVRGRGSGGGWGARRAVGGRANTGGMNAETGLVWVCRNCDGESKGFELNGVLNLYPTHPYMTGIYMYFKVSYGIRIIYFCHNLSYLWNVLWNF